MINIVKGLPIPIERASYKPNVLLSKIVKLTAEKKNRILMMHALVQRIGRLFLSQLYTAALRHI